MSRAINGLPPLNLKSTPGTSSGQIYGAADSDPNSFQLLVNWFMNENIKTLSQVGYEGESGESQSDPLGSLFGSSTFGGSQALSGNDPYSVMGMSAMQGVSPTLAGMSPYGDLSGLAVNNPILDLQRLQAFNDYSNLVNEDNPTAASYFDPNSGKTLTGIIEEVAVGKSGEVSFKINGEFIPLTYVKSLTRYEEEV
ncbi:MAG: hypothetical protein KKA19_09530 [Candidatus Margulisbacteria bacterium]|nr:hypothetical protein [Candidatus Margulisiibacteriota bacterium]